MSTHPNYSTPSPDLLPAAVRVLAEEADAAGQRAHDLKQRADIARRKLTEAEQSWPRAVAEAAADPNGKQPTDRRPALAAEVERAEEMARAADVHARGVWQRLRDELAHLDPAALAEVEPPIVAAADEYRAAIAQVEQAREAMHEAMRVRQWISAGVIGTPGYTGQVTPRLGTYRPNRPAPDTLPRAGRLHDLTMTEVVACLTADADALDTLRAKEERNAGSAARERAAKEWQAKFASVTNDDTSTSQPSVSA